MSLAAMIFIKQFEAVKARISSLSDGDFLIIAGTVSKFIDEEMHKRGIIIE